MAKAAKKQMKEKEKNGKKKLAKRHRHGCPPAAPRPSCRRRAGSRTRATSAPAPRTSR
ncbi:MAG: hypothetical protein WDN72_01860 [Alphaproteobacteria bacterium]